jgi:hypothetical protein
MNATCMCPEVETGVKTTAQKKYEDKMARYNANKERKEKKAMEQLNNLSKLNGNTNNKQKQSKPKRGTNNIEVGVRDPFYLYCFKIINKRTMNIYYKIGIS